jgi:sulfur relay (sulfurtransferase) complex TusBCD TusD component (DsrE family)
MDLTGTILQPIKLFINKRQKYQGNSMNQSTTPNPILANKKLGLLLSTAPDNPNSETVYQLSKTALANKVDTYLYFIDEGVLNLKDPRFAELAKEGLKLFVCAYGCQQHGISTDGYGKEVNFCGLVILSNIIDGCDRFLAFN